MSVDTARATLNGTKIAGGHDADPSNGWFGGFAFRFDASRQEVDRRYSAHRLRFDDFKEKGGTAALRGRGKTWKHATSTLGLRLSTSPKARVSFDADVGWRH
ncbi:MAG: autotransporter outer membrane beta-barrel domain-containing protein, partial [Candidatus Accumulibacter sp.]|nr:autotransporter outer membrane beta-barrel domain-containing protein [Accumulibacter sp.]